MKAALMLALCAFLGLEFDDAVVRFHEGRTRTGPGISAKHAWLPPTPGLRDWRAQMSRDAVERVEAAAGDLLDELGYERRVPRPRAERLAHAERLAATFPPGHAEHATPVSAP